MFRNCSNLKNFVIPSSVEEIGVGVFRGCCSLVDFIVDPQNQFFTTKDGILFSADMTSFFSYPCSRTGNHYSIPEGVQIIEYSALNDNPNVTSLTIPKSVTNVKLHGLNGNPNLSNE